MSSCRSGILLCALVAACGKGTSKDTTTSVAPLLAHVKSAAVTFLDVDKNRRPANDPFNLNAPIPVSVGISATGDAFDGIVQIGLIPGDNTDNSKDAICVIGGIEFHHPGGGTALAPTEIVVSRELMIPDATRQCLGGATSRSFNLATILDPYAGETPHAADGQSSAAIELHHHRYNIDDASVQQTYQIFTRNNAGAHARCRTPNVLATSGFTQGCVIDVLIDTIPNLDLRVRDLAPVSSVGIIRTYVPKGEGGTPSQNEVSGAKSNLHNPGVFRVSMTVQAFSQTFDRTSGTQDAVKDTLPNASAEVSYQLRWVGDSGSVTSPSGVADWRPLTIYDGANAAGESEGHKLSETVTQRLPPTVPVHFSHEVYVEGDTYKFLRDNHQLWQQDPLFELRACVALKDADGKRLPDFNPFNDCKAQQVRLALADTLGRFKAVGGYEVVNGRHAMTCNTGAICFNPGIDIPHIAGAWLNVDSTMDQGTADGAMADFIGITVELFDHPFVVIGGATSMQNNLSTGAGNSAHFRADVAVLGIQIHAIDETSDDIEKNLRITPGGGKQVLPRGNFGAPPTDNKKSAGLEIPVEIELEVITVLVKFGISFDGGLAAGLSINHHGTCPPESLNCTDLVNRGASLAGSGIANIRAETGIVAGVNGLVGAGIGIGPLTLGLDFRLLLLEVSFVPIHELSFAASEATPSLTLSDADMGWQAIIDTLSGHLIFWISLGPIPIWSTDVASWPPLEWTFQLADNRNQLDISQ